jgi:hypothetical protein
MKWQEEGSAVRPAAGGNLRARARWMLARTLSSNPATAALRNSGGGGGGGGDTDPGGGAAAGRSLNAGGQIKPEPLLLPPPSSPPPSRSAPPAPYQQPQLQEAMATFHVPAGAGEPAMHFYSMLCYFLLQCFLYFFMLYFI